jgi:RHS repeat-associated protein
VVVEATDKAGNETVETFTLFFDPKARATYRYDLNGNLIQKTEKGVVWRYAWDAENRLIRVRKATTHASPEGSAGQADPTSPEATTGMGLLEVEYGYYDNGNRAWKRVTELGQEPVVTHYVHDGIHVIAEYNGEGTLLKEYVYSGNIDEVLNIKDGTENFFPHQDGLNSVVAVTDAGGERVASYNYEAFGTIKDATGALGNPITYTGRWIEPETGDYFYRARYYDAGVGRFVSKDPIREKSGDYNYYRYVFNNPVKYNDPFGLDIYLKTGNDAKILFTNIPNPLQDLLHQNICVDTWQNGKKQRLRCFTFGATGIDLNTGDDWLGYDANIYAGVLEGTVVESFYIYGRTRKSLHTECEDDLDFERFLISKLGMKATYGLSLSCRTFAQKMFDEAKQRYGS